MDFGDRGLYGGLEFDPWFEGRFLDVYPGFGIYPEYDIDGGKVRGLSLNKVMRYIFFVYQKGSPLFGEVDLRKRKLLAADMVGFVKRGDGKFGHDVSRLLLCDDGVFVRMVLRFLRIQNDVYWTQLCIYEQSRQAQYEKLLLDDWGSGESPGKARVYIKEVTEDIEVLRDRILFGDGGIDLERALYEAVDIELMCPTAEDVAMALRSGELRGMLPNYYYVDKV